MNLPTSRRILEAWHALRKPALRSNAEFEQAVIRLLVGAVVLAYVLVFDRSSNDIQLRNILAGTFLLFSSLLLVHIVRHPGDIRHRKQLGILNDTFFISASMLVAGQNGQPIYLVYLWVIFGNGFRFGTEYLKVALFLSISGFALVIAIDGYWQEHFYQGVALLAGLALLSAYFGMLLKRLTEALKAQESANAAKRQFISSVSHELRTPLNAIIGITDLLESTEEMARHKEMLRTLTASSRLMHTLIDDVLDFSKIEAGKIVIERAVFDIHDLVERSIALFRPQAAQKSLALSVAVADGVPRCVVGDASHLQQVLVNLLSNALKFTPAGRIELRIRRVSEPEGEACLLFEVEDTGIGIHHDEQEKIFDSFTQASASTHRHYGGTGLGTTISRNLVQQMGGELALRSAPGVGSTFYFTLSFRIAPMESTAADAPLRPATSFTVIRRSGKSYRILVADDNPTNRAIVHAIIERAGHTCTLADNGDDALDCMEREDFDAIVLDLHMPVLNGIDTLKTYRIITREEHRLPVIIFSADASIETEKECMAAGADAFISKPIHADRFLQTIETLAGRLHGHVRAPRPPARVAPRLRIQPSSQHILDYSTLATLESISPSEEFIGGLIDAFVADGKTNLAKLEFALRNGRVDECRHILHAMRGSAVGIGATALAGHCTMPQTDDGTTFPDALKATVIAVGNEMAAASDALAEYRCTRLQRLNR